MLMYQKILLTTDGSVHSLKAAEAARELAVLVPGAEVTMLHVISITPELTAGLQQKMEKEKISLERSMLEETKPIFDKTIDVLKRKNLKIHTRLERGCAEEQIPRVANSGDYDLVVIGSRGLGDWQQILLGSVSEKVCHGSHIPVLIVK